MRPTLREPPVTSVMHILLASPMRPTPRRPPLAFQADLEIRPQKHFLVTNRVRLTLQLTLRLPLPLPPQKKGIGSSLELSLDRLPTRLKSLLPNDDFARYIN